MFRKSSQNRNNELDQTGRCLLKASAVPDEDAEAAAASPLLFVRIRSQIARERSEREGTEGGIQLGVWLASRRAIPVMSLTAALSFGLLLYVNAGRVANPSFSVDGYLGANGSGIDRIVFNERPVTGEEVLATIVSRDERETSR